MHPKIVLSENKKTFISKRWKEKQSTKYEISSTYIIMIGFTFSLLIYYIWTINANATIGFNIRQLELEKKNLLIKEEQLNVKIAKLESLDNIKEEDTKNMEEARNNNFLVIKEGFTYVYNN